jgi:hypothetical protein
MTDKDQEDDPIIAEIRAIRDEHAKRFNYDIEAILVDLRLFEKTLNLEPQLASRAVFKNTGS